jgi:hypothetical protein
VIWYYENMRRVRIDVDVGLSELTRREKMVADVWNKVRLSCLLPLAIDADSTAEGSSETNNTVVESDPAESGEGDGHVAEIAEKLDLASGAFAARIVG